MGFQTINPATTITANRLSDGVVVFLARDFAWSEKLSDALVLQGEAEAENALKSAESLDSFARIVSPYPIDVEIHANQPIPRPRRLRERIRATGPTTLIPGNRRV